MQATLTQTTVYPTEVFKTKHGAVYQCDSDRCWFVDFAGKNARFDYRCLMKLRKAIYHINIEEKLLQTDKSPDVEIVFICACDHTYVLTLLQIIAFKELLEGAFTMLELNRIINDRLYRVCV